MAMTEYITPILTALGGGLVGTYFTYRINNRKQKSSEFEILLKERKEITQQLSIRLDVLENEIKILRAKESEQAIEIANLRNQLMVFESSHTDIPLPMWMKDHNGIMIFLNSYYEDAFLLPRDYVASDYIGKDDFSVWNEEVAKAFIKNDNQVIRTKKHVDSIEKLDDGNGDFIYAQVLKYPRKYNNKVIGISGIVLRTALTEEELK